MVERYVKPLSAWIDDTLHYRKLKAILCACPSLIQVLATAIAYYSFFVGNYVDESFPKGYFWCVTAVIALIVIVFNYCKNLNGKYAKLFMVDFEFKDTNTVFYYFNNRKDLGERAIVEVREVKNSRTVPYALAYIEGQDVSNRKLMTVRPIAFYKNNCYQKGPSEFIKKKNYSKYILVSKTIKKEDLDSIDL